MNILCKCIKTFELITCLVRWSSWINILLVASSVVAWLVLAVSVLHCCRASHLVLFVAAWRGWEILTRDRNWSWIHCWITNRKPSLLYSAYSARAYLLLIVVPIVSWCLDDHILTLAQLRHLINCCIITIIIIITREGSITNSCIISHKENLRKELYIFPCLLFGFNALTLGYHHYHLLLAYTTRL